MQKYKLAVCMPAYNAEKFILKSIQSVLDQSYTSFILIIRDDCSSDATVDVIESLGDSRIIVQRNERNLGAVPTRNKMIDYCVSEGYEFMGIMDADDIAYPQRFKKQMAILHKDPSLAVCGSSMKIERTGGEWEAKPSPLEIKVECLFGNPIPTSSAIMRVRYIKQYGLRWDKSFSPCADYHLWARMLFEYNLRARNTGDVDMLYTYSPEGVSHGQGLEKQENQDARVKMSVLKHLGVELSDDEVASFMRVALYRSSDAGDAGGYVKVSRQLLQKARSGVVDYSELRRAISIRSYAYLNKTPGILESTRQEIYDYLVLPGSQALVLFENILKSIKLNLLDTYFPGVSLRLVGIYVALRGVVNRLIKKLVKLVGG